MLYIITISSNYIRDAQYADTFGLSDSEVREDIFMDRIRRSQEQGRNLFFEEWPLFVHEWETDPDVIL